MSASAPRSPLAAAIASSLSETTTQTLRPSVRNSAERRDEGEQRTDERGAEDDQPAGLAIRLRLGLFARGGVVDFGLFLHRLDIDACGFGGCLRSGFDAGRGLRADVVGP